MAKRKKNEDEPSQDNLENQNDSDSFGLPDLEYKPLDEQPQATEENKEEPMTQSESKSYSYNEEETPLSSNRESSYTSAIEPEKSKAPVIIAVIIGLVVIVAAGLLYLYVYKPQAEKAKQELAAQEKKRRDEEAARLALEREEAERKRLEAEAAAAASAKPAVGVIETLSERTKRYYVVVASAVDGDLVMDYAKKLSVKGVSTKIIPPFGKWKFYRIAISDYDTFATAQTSADVAKTEYGGGVWVIKY